MTESLALHRHGAGALVGFVMSHHAEEPTPTFRPVEGDLVGKIIEGDSNLDLRRDRHPRHVHPRLHVAIAVK